MSIQIVRRETVGDISMRLIHRPVGYYLMLTHLRDEMVPAHIVFLARDFGQAMRRMDLRVEYVDASAEDVA